MKPSYYITIPFSETESKEKKIARKTHREEIGGGIDGEEGDLVNLRPEDRDLRVFRGERESAITGGEQSVVVGELITGRERNSKGKAVRFLDRGVGAGREDTVIVGRFREYGQHRHECQQNRGSRNRH